MTRSCNDGHNLCPSGYAEHTSCAIKAKCAKGWADTCKLDPNKC